MPTDFHSWVGLGEAYTNSGRYIAALKAFREAERLDDGNWLVKYMIANVNRELGEFGEACEDYRHVLTQKPGEFGVLMALSETLVAMANNHVEKGYYGQATEAAVEALEVSREISSSRADTFNLWKNVADACLLFSWIQGFSAEVPLELVKELISLDIDRKELNVMSDLDGVGSSTLDLLTKEEPLLACIYLGILACKRAIYVSAADRHAHAVAWFNLGCAEFRAYGCLPAKKAEHHMSAIRCFKRAIKVEPGNQEFWNALGVASAEVSPRAAQHALVRSLYINDKVSGLLLYVASSVC